MWFRRRQKPEPANAVRQLREQAFMVSAAELNIRPSEQQRHVWGVLMETGIRRPWLRLWRSPTERRVCTSAMGVA